MQHPEMFGAMTCFCQGKGEMLCIGIILRKGLGRMSDRAFDLRGNNVAKI